MTIHFHHQQSIANLFISMQLKRTHGFAFLVKYIKIIDTSKLKFPLVIFSLLLLRGFKQIIKRQEENKLQSLFVQLYRMKKKID